MGQRPVLMIDATDDFVLVTGLRDVVARVVDLPNARYLEFGDYVRAEVFDPVAARNRQEVNAVFRAARVA